MTLQDIKKAFGLKLDECNSMAELRKEIDLLDNRIVDLITIRQSYMDQAARIKKDRDTVRDEDRVEDVLTKVSKYASDSGTSPELVKSLYSTMIEWSINYEFDKFDEKLKKNR